MTTKWLISVENIGDITWQYNKNIDFGRYNKRQMGIDLPNEKIKEFCRRNHIRRMALFGSVLRDDFTPISDVDILVEFEAGKTPGLAFFSMERELGEMLGRKVDLNTPGFLSQYFRDSVMASARNVYVSA